MRLIIEEVVLRGFPAADRTRIGDAFASALKTYDWISVSPGDRLPTLNLRLREGDTPERIGQALGEALFQALDGGTT